jgi:nucleotide-binding universal stress UspA family protein
MKAIMLHVHEDSGQEARLRAGLDIARAHSGHITCLQIAPFSAFVASDPFGGVYALPGVLDALHDQQAKERAALEDRLRQEDVSWDVEDCTGEIARSLISRSRLADVIILSRAAGAVAHPDQPLPIVADVAVHARAPVIAVPPEATGLACNGPMMVAWNGSIEASHALRFALPLLRLASKIHIVTVPDDRTDFPATLARTYLARHGLAAELREWPCTGRDVTGALIDAANELGAACAVMGAYGHSRLREALLGGVTRDLLDQSPFPLFLAH